MELQGDNSLLWAPGANVPDVADDMVWEGRFVEMMGGLEWVGPWGMVSRGAG